MATATITYTMSPSTSSIMCQTTTNPPALPCFQRRSSIRRGTISSLSKDVRVNDFVEIIKKQKAIQQKERDVDTSSMMLKRRHSMMNMSNRVVTTKKPNLPSRIRTMSNSDLKVNAAANAAAAATYTTDNNATTTVAASATSPSATHASNMEKASSGRIRLDEKNKGKCKSPTPFSQEQQQKHQETVINHLRKCAACHENKKEINLASKGVSAAEVAAAASSITSASFSSDSTVSSCSSLSSYKNEDTFDSHPQRAFIIKELNQCMADYSSKMDQMLNKKENNIQACKQLIAQQQELLSQLEALDKELPPEAPHQPTPSSSLPPPPSSSSVDLLKSVFALRPKPQIVIRQTADKNEADTIFSLEGACTTAVNTCYIPDEIKSAASKSTTQYTYTLNLTHQDRLNKFVLKPSNQWQADHQVDTCQDKQCDQGFNWFQRKHHCRG
ncbi:SWI/SNF and RSC complex subunit Ssr3 [Mucor velutinosus]|uniref:SWI/SNF and RSC complex subunit Ssr3 n=1 Tax=Mucor velutinosus TaxID=708070 RepID=A0AAN7HV18_9FUNG|nr:SWI/SNF and RSC complex subunit Ssr3 [Mucor velutinosus]